MTETADARPDTVEQTPWSSRLTLPLRAFQRTETASAGVLAAAIGVALVWANLGTGYEDLWSTELSLRLGDLAIEQDRREWLSSGLMTLFFLVVGLEARREFDLGELRDRKRFLVPLVAGVLGMLLPVLLYLAVTHGTDAASGWGVAMSTDTALALGFLSVLGRAVPGRVRVYLLTVLIVDDLVALAVIAGFYSGPISWWPLVVAVAVFAVFLGTLRYGVDVPLVYAVMGVVIWGALRASGVGPGRGRADDRPGRLGVHPEPGHPRTRQQPVSPVPRGTDRRAGPYGVRRADRGALAERPAAALLPAVDQLRDRAALRARERRVRHRQRIPRACRAVAGHVGHRARLRRRQADRDRHGDLAGHHAECGPDPLTPRLGRARGERHHRRHRVHCVATDRHAGVPGRRAGRGQGGGAGRRGRVGPAYGGCLPADPTDAAAASGARAAGSRRAAGRPRRTGRPGARPHPGVARRPRDAGRVRRLRVPALRGGRGGRPRGAGRGLRPALRLA